MKLGWVVLRLLRRETRTMVVLVLLAAVLGAAFSALNAVQSSVRSAADDGVASQAAGYEWQLEVVASGDYDSLLSARDDMVPVWVEAVEVESLGRLSTAEALFVAERDVAYGTLLAGTRPYLPGEATVSTELADRLGLRVGDGITISDSERQFEVVGIHVVETAPNQPVIAAYVTMDEMTGSPAKYLTNTKFEQFGAELKDALEERSVIMRSTGFLTFLQEESVGATYGGPLAVALLALGFMCAVILGSVLRLSDLAMAGEREGLQAAGMTPRRAHAIVRSASGGSVLVGTVVGLASVAALSGVLATRVAPLFSQYWTTTTTSSTATALYGTGLVGVVLLLPRAIQRYRKTSLAKPKLFKTLMMGVGGVALVALARGGHTSPAVAGRMVGGLMVSWSIVGVLTVAVQAGRRSERQAFARIRWQVVRRSLAMLGVVTALVYITSAISGTLLQQAADNRLMYSGASVWLPPGSLQIELLGASDAIYIGEQFEKRGGEAFLPELTNEKGGVQIRATTTRLLSCLEASPSLTFREVYDTCPGRDAVSQVAVDVLGSGAGRLSSSRPVAEPALLDDDARFGLIAIDAGTDKVLEIWVLEAEPGPILGNSIAGVILGPDVAMELGFKTSGIYQVALLEFADLPKDRKAEMRSIMANRASGALINEDLGNQDGGLTGAAVLIAVVGAVLTVLIVGSWGSGLAEAELEARRALLELGAGAAIRVPAYVRALIGLLLVGPVVALVVFLAPVLSAMTPLSAIPVVWLLPALAAVVSSVWVVHVMTKEGVATS
ncbi:hypothetical protein MNBD_ACTINO02-1593 [hydrothermal vent metagenome]|uniref:Uncharacterized protein n=1 Tax=hydrothermal vent metagenome TaxID=652676 RepID=A0A3B0S4C5_9ZZZZ